MKKNILKRLASLLLALVLVVSLLPGLAVEAEAVSKKHSGSGITLSATTMYCSHCSKLIDCGSISITSVSLAGRTLTIEATLTTKVHGTGADAVNNKIKDYVTITCSSFDCNTTYSNRSMGSSGWITTSSNGSYRGNLTVSRAAGHSVVSGSVSSNNDGTHNLTCNLCGNATENCKMSTANCVTPATCSICSYTDGHYDFDNHSWGQWETTDTAHSRTCANGCGETDSGNHTGGTASCTQKATCSVCNTAYGSVNSNGHNWLDNWTTTDTTHSRTCANGCGATDSGNHTGGTASCSQKATCSVCNTAYGSVNSNGHNWGDNWTTTDTTHSRTCANGCGATDSGNHTGGTATCTEKAVCSVCNTAYGSTLTHSLSYSKDGANKLVESCQHNCGHKATATLKAANSTYTGSAVTASMEYDSNWLGSNKPTVVTYDGDNINVGTATAKITVEGKELTASYTISAAELTVTAEGFNGSFDFNPHGITVTATDVQGNPVTVKYGTTEGTYNLDASPTVTDATEGTRTVYYKVEKANHNPVTGSATITVNPRYYPYAISNSGAYTGKPHDFTPTLACDGYTLVEGIDYTFDGWDQEMIYPGEYTSKVTFRGNFKDTKEVTYTIVTNSLSNVSVSQKGTLTYNGQPQTPEVNASATTADGAPVSFSYTKSSNGTGYGSMPSFTNAGTYTVYYRASAQYHSSRTGSFNVVINKQAVPAPAIGSKVYNGQTLTADITGTDLYTVTKNEGGTNAGEYDVVLTLTDTANYKWESTESADLTLKFTITPADNSWEEAPSIEGWTYGETAATPNNGKAKFGEATVKYVGTANDGTGYDSEQPPELAGQYKAIFTVSDESGSYNPLTKEVPFTIARAALPTDRIFSISVPKMAYNGLIQNDILVTTYLTGVTADDITINYSAEPRNAGDYTFTLSVAQTSNYEASTAPLTNDNWKFTIDKATPTITWDVNETFTYNGQPHGSATVMLVNNETYSGTVTYSYRQGEDAAQEGLPVDAGTYTATASIPEQPNYNPATATTTIVIRPKEVTPTVVIDPVSFTYDGESKEPDVKVLDGETEIEPFEYTLTYQNAASVGAATVTVSDAANGNYTISAVTKTYLILPDASALKDVTTGNVNAGDQAAIDEIQAAMENVDITGTDEAAKKQWNDLLDRCDDLEKKIEDTADAQDELASDLADLPAQPTTDDLDAIEDLLDDYDAIKGNLTEAEKKALEDDIEKLEAQKAAITAVNTGVEDVCEETAELEEKEDLVFADRKTIDDLQKQAGELEKSPYLTDEQEQALEDAKKALAELESEFEDAVKVEKLLNDLPEAVDPDDEDAIKAYKAAKKAYNALGDDKAKVDPDAVKKLEALKAELTDYRIIKYSKAKWTKGSSSGLTLTANGHFDNFVGVKMDGKYIDSKNYTAKAGSTIVTLKASYLQKLKTGKHTVAVCFGDGDFTGEADFTFKVASSTAVSPATGDSSNILLWSGLTVCSAAALAALVVLKKRRYQK